MCGRFALTTPWKTLTKLLRGEVEGDLEGGFEPAYNICPTDLAPVLRLDVDGGRVIAPRRWGLVPWWSKDRRGAARLINARSETAATTRAFREAFRGARCVVPASGFFEWTSAPEAPKKRLPHWIHDPDGRLLLFAGLWARWHDPETREALETFTILTTAANDDVAALHDRMPVVLDEEAERRWLDPDSDPGLLTGLCRPYAGRLAHHRVSPRVNDVRADGPDLLAPLAPEPGENLLLDL